MDKEPRLDIGPFRQGHLHPRCKTSPAGNALDLQIYDGESFVLFSASRLRKSTSLRASHRAWACSSPSVERRDRQRVRRASESRGRSRVVHVFAGAQLGHTSGQKCPNSDNHEDKRAGQRVF